MATFDGQIVGVGRYIRLGIGDAAEVAFVVQDGYQGHGIGSELLTLLAPIGWGVAFGHVPHEPDRPALRLVTSLAEIALRA